MKNVSYSLLRSIAALIIGLLLVLFPEQAGDYFVITIGVVFIIPSLISIAGYLMHKSDGQIHYRFPIEGLGSLLFGLWLMIAPGFFADLLTYIIGFVVVMGSIYQIAILIAAKKWTQVSFGFFVMPVLVLLAGLVALFNPTGVRATAFIILGVTCLVYAIMDLVNWLLFTRRRPQIKDVDDVVVVE